MVTWCFQGRRNGSEGDTRTTWNGIGEQSRCVSMYPYRNEFAMRHMPAYAYGTTHAHLVTPTRGYGVARYSAQVARILSWSAGMLRDQQLPYTVRFRWPNRMWSLANVVVIPQVPQSRENWSSGWCTIQHKRGCAPSIKGVTRVTAVKVRSLRMRDFVGCNILSQFAILQRCFCTSTLKNKLFRSLFLSHVLHLYYYYTINTTISPYSGNIPISPSCHLSIFTVNFNYWYLKNVAS
jgi:hypothetical protein